MNRNLDSLSAPAVSELADAPRQLEHFRTVYELTDSVLRARGPEEIYQAALHGLERAVGTKRSAILLYDSDDVMRFKAWHDLSDGYRAAVEGHSPWPRDAMDPQPVLVPDVKLDAGLTSYLDLFRSEGIGALAFIPLLARGRLIGKFMLYFADAHPFTEDEVRLAGVIAGHVALAVERKRVEGALEYLAGASAVLDCSLDFDATLAEVARRMVPYVADWVLVETLDDAAHLEPAAGVHADPLLADALTRLIALRGSVDGSSSLALQAIRTGRTTLEMNAREALVSEFGGQGPSGELLQGLGCRSAIAMALRARGRVLGSITLVSKNRVLDVRDVALAEDLARRGAVALDNARLYREAQDSDRRKEEFLAVLAHELRNPLMPLLTCLELMRAPGAPAESLHRWREIMERQIRSLTRLVDDLLDVSRISRGKIELQKQSIDLGTVVTRAVETTRPLYESRRIALSVDMGRGARLEGDPLRLEQVLANLLNNAAKFTPSGGRVEVLGGLEGETVSLRVRDHGVGLESDMLNRVFDLFVQASKPSGGLGIGLTLARTLVELHGGTIHAESDGAGRGSDFVVRLPVGRPTSAPASPVPPEAPARPPDILGLRVLIVDDNLDGATALAEALRRRGHQLQLAHDGQSAIREASRFGPDLVLLDLGLPDMDGFEVASQLQAMTDLARTRIVAVSGYGQEQVQRQSAAMGFAAHLVKPIDQASLDTVIRRLAAEGPSAR